MFDLIRLSQCWSLSLPGGDKMTLLNFRLLCETVMYGSQKNKSVWAREHRVAHVNIHLFKQSYM